MTIRSLFVFLFSVEFISPLTFFPTPNFTEKGVQDGRIKTQFHCPKSAKRKLYG
jgi:hypothetical protein